MFPSATDAAFKLERGGFATDYGDSVSDTEASIRARPCDPWSIKKAADCFYGIEKFRGVSLNAPALPVL
jgi:hypothetical protein